MNMMNKVLVAGCSGFIGMHFCRKLLEKGYEVLGLDNMNDYYSVRLKQSRLARLKKFTNFKFENINISEKSLVQDVFKNFKPDRVVNLAAQAGVRYSIKNPDTYIQTNIVGFLNILESCRKNDIGGLVYASSSSVYGGNKELPFKEKHNCDKPLSIYAASKKGNELMAYSYSRLYGLKTTGLRYFTVYGPWGRPDMAIFSFVESILKNKPICLFNYGDMIRDFTFIDDIINGTMLAFEKNYSCEIFNLGNNRPIKLKELIHIIENKLGKKAEVKFKKIQKGDVQSTHSDISYSKKKLGYIPRINVDQGIESFIKWYKTYKNLS